ncbi:MAG: hypothetical protein CG439_1921 [Methylococcaceae bacterium NSP1-2]|nr:MAG: hypothetical protein CG439_1921 [Methylococcaceae bacterium NSP1-2]
MFSLLIDNRYLRLTISYDEIINTLHNNLTMNEKNNMLTPLPLLMKAQCLQNYYSDIG